MKKDVGRPRALTLIGVLVLVGLTWLTRSQTTTPDHVCTTVQASQLCNEVFG